MTTMNGIQINGDNLNSFPFADDIIRISESIDELQQIILQLHIESQIDEYEEK